MGAMKFSHPVPVGRCSFQVDFAGVEKMSGLSGLVTGLKNMFTFAPHDANKLWQTLPQKMVSKEGVERIQGFRYPSPGSAAPTARVPVRETSDEVYNIQHYTRDPRNWPVDGETGVNASTGPIAIDTNVAVSKHGGSRPDGNPAVLAYDPTGLRSARSASWASFDSVIEGQREKMSVPLPVHHKTLAAENEQRVERGVPPTLGKRFVPRNMSDNYNEVRW